MHELTITQNILSIVLAKAKAVEAKRVTRINLTTGELAGVVDECVQFYFDLLGKETIAAQATLVFEHPPTKLRCRKCATIFSPGELNWECPGCHEQKVEIVSGRECFVSSIEVD